MWDEARNLTAAILKHYIYSNAREYDDLPGKIELIKIDPNFC